MMPPVQLSTDLSDALRSLLKEDQKIVDAIEVGPWFTPEQIRGYRHLLPGMPFHFHAADLIEDVGAGQAGVQQFIDYLACSQSPWTSVHLSVWQPGEIKRLKGGEQVPLPGPQRAAQRFTDKVAELARSIQVPVLIENVEPLPLEGYDFWSQPGFIHRILEVTGCGFLLDTGHARISAQTLTMTAVDYLQQLPLERVVQVHVSGPRDVDGHLADLHQPLQEEDYDMLEFIFDRVRPQVVTLEYIQDAELLRSQLNRLRCMLN